ncbi:MAG: TPM domain-containing protein [Candidatus Margulisbacteria bacterium]|nr:TPM domain-containing protein [Candidatus Margulisiibacteriota bacterium]
MRKNILVLFFLLFCSLANTYFVFDEARILSAQEQSAVESVIGQWTQQTKHQMAVVTVKSLNGQSVEEYAVKKFSQLGIGQKGKNDGLLFVVAPNDRKMRIEVGYGLEGFLPDGLVGEIRDKYIIPFFKINQFGLGILNGTKALIIYEAQREGIALPDLDTNQLAEPAIQNIQLSKGQMIAGIFFFAIFLLVFIAIVRALGWDVVWPFLLMMLFSSGGGRSNRNGGFGGGFGGFGGGMSGGGGASGGW